MVKQKTKDALKATARDLLIAVLIVVIIMGLLYAYCRVWPPIVVVESGSMMHSDDSQIGVIDTGDMVLVQQVDSKDEVVTYLEGEGNNYITYSGFGDVIVYYQADQTRDAEAAAVGQ